MKTLSFWKKSLYSALIFFGTLIALSVGYGALTGGLSNTDKVGSGSGLTSASWNRIVDGVLDLDSRLSNFSFVGGNVGIGTVSPGAKLDVAGDIKASAGGMIGVTKVGGAFGNSTTNIPNGAWTYIGDNITLTPGNWIVYYNSFYDTDWITSFTIATSSHPIFSSNTNNTGLISFGNINACIQSFCPFNQIYQVSVASTATYYIVHYINNYGGSYVRLRGSWGNFFAIKVN